MGYSLQPSMSLRKEEIMAWWENDRVTQRTKLIMEWLSGGFTVTELARRHDISRPDALAGGRSLPCFAG